MHPRIAQRRSTISEDNARDELCRQIIALLNAMQQFFEAVGAGDCDFAEHRALVGQVAARPDMPTEQLLRLSEQLQTMTLNIISKVRGQSETMPDY